MTVLFVHDHQFSAYKNNFYSPGKLDYDKLEFYRSIFDDVDILGRTKTVVSLTKSMKIVNGPSVNVIGFESQSSIRRLFFRGRARRVMGEIVSQYDCVVVRLPSELGLLAFYAAKKLNKKIFVEVVASAFDCLYFQGGILAKIYAPILEWRVKKACRKADYLSYVTSSYLQKKYPSNNAATLSITDCMVDPVDTARCYDKKDVYWVGVIGDPDLLLKGIADAIKCLSIVRGNGFDIRLRVLGGSGAGFIDSFGSPPSWVSFDGVLSGRDAVNSWLDGLDVYMQPSHTEGLPRSLLEGMSVGLPCIAYAVGGIPELLPSSALARPRNVQELSEILNSLVCDVDFYNALASSCLLKSREFSSDKVISMRHNFYSAFRSQVSS